MTSIALSCSDCRVALVDCTSIVVNNRELCCGVVLILSPARNVA